MSDTSTGDPGKPMEQPKNDISEAMRQLSVTSNEISTPSKNLSDMPVDVVGLITEKLDYKQQLKLRKVSKSLRALVDSRKPGCKTIRIFFYKEHLNIIFNNQCVMYRSLDYKCKNNTGIVVKRDDFKKVAFDDLASTLENPKLQLETFVVRFFSFYETDYEDYKECCNEIRNLLTALDHQVSVKKIELMVASPSCLLSFLPFLKPGLLEKISLNLKTLAFIVSDLRNDSDGMEKVSLLEQWKQAKELQLPWSFDRLPVKYATHFKRFYIRESKPDNNNKLLRIIDCLSKLQNFEQCTLSCIEFLFRPALVSQVLGAAVSSTATEEVFHYSIPDSDYYLEIKKATGSSELEITKKKRESK